MTYETTYWFFNLLLCGLITSEIYYKIGRSQRGGMALGLIFFGFIWALTLDQSRGVVKREWLRIGAILLLIVSLTCTGELLWGEARFKVIMTTILISVGLLSAWSKGDVLNLPPAFWLPVGAGAVVATFVLGRAHVDMGAYVGAWVWVILGLIFKPDANEQ